MHLDCKKAETELNWKPKINIEKGIKNTLKWWKNNIQ